MTDYFYSVYSLNISSDRPIPGLLQVKTEPAHLEVCLSSRPFSWFKMHEKDHGHPPQQEWFDIKDSKFGSLLRWKNLFSFFIEKNSPYIYYHIDDSTHIASWGIYCLSWVLSFKLLEKGYECFHGSSVYLNGQTIWILGDCGYGKTTLIYHLLRQGSLLVSDDLLTFQSCHNQLHSTVGPSRIKIFPNHLQANPFPILQKMNPLTGKRILQVPGVDPTVKSLPIKGIYVLTDPQKQPHSKITLTPMPPTDALKSLLANLYNTCYLSNLRMRTQFHQINQLINHIPIKFLRYPRRLSAMTKVCQRLTQDSTNHA